MIFFPNKKNKPIEKRFTPVEIVPKTDETGQWWFEGRKVYLRSHPEWKKEFVNRHLNEEFKNELQ